MFIHFRGFMAYALRTFFVLFLSISLLEATRARAETGVAEGPPLRFEAPFQGEQLTYIALPDGVTDFEIPLVFADAASAGAMLQFRSSARTLEGRLASETYRRALYRNAVLSMISAPELARVKPEAAATLFQTRRHGAAAQDVLGLVAGASARAGELEQIIGQDHAVSETLQAISADSRSLGYLTQAAAVASELSDQNARVALLTDAAADAELIAALHALADMIASQPRHDPAMVAGIARAINDIQQLGESRFRQMAAAGGATLRNEFRSLATMALLAKTTGPAGIALREAVEMQGLVDGFTEQALLVSALHNIAARSVAPARQGLAALAPDAEGGNAADASSATPWTMLALVHARLGAEATAMTYTTLWKDRWDNPLSLAAVARGLGLTRAESREGQDGMRAAWRDIVARRAEDVRTYGGAVPADAMAGGAGAMEPWTFLERIAVELPAGFTSIRETGSIVLLGHGVESLPGVRLDTQGGDTAILLNVTHDTFGRPFLEENADALLEAGYTNRPFIVDHQPTAEIARTLSIARPGDGAPRRTGLSAFDHAISIYVPLPEDDAGGITIFLAGYRMDEETRNTYAAAAQALSDTLRLMLPDEVAALTPDLTAQDWIDPELRLLEGHAGGIHAVRFSPDGSRVLTAAEDGRVRIFDPQTGRRGAELHVSRQWVEDAIYTPDGSRIVTLVRAGGARYWDANTGRGLFGLHDYRGDGLLVFSPDGAFIVTPHRGDLQIRENDTGQVVATQSGHEGRVMALEMSPDGARVATGSADRTVRLWDLPSGREERRFGPLTSVINDVAFSPDGAFIAAAPSNADGPVWRLSDGAKVHQFDGGGGLALVRFSPDGERLLTGALNGTIRIWDMETGDLQTEFAAGPSNLQDVAFSPDGLVVATGAMRGDARLWDARTGALLADLELRRAGLSRLAFSPDGRMLAVTTGEEGAAALWMPRD